MLSLALTAGIVSAGIWYVHWEQKEEKRKLREGVLRDKIRLEKKLLSSSAAKNTSRTSPSPFPSSDKRT